MPNGSVEGAARLYQGGKAGRGSFLRLAGRAVEAGIVAAAIQQLEPAQNALAKTTTREQRRDTNTADGNDELKQNTALTTPSAQNRTEQAEALLGLPDPLTEIIATTTILGIAGIGIAVLKRRHERHRRKLDPLVQQIRQIVEERRRLRREAEEQVRLEDYRRRTREADEQERQKQKRVEEDAIARRTIQELAQEVRDERIDQLAEEVIKNGLWKDKRHRRIHLKPVHEPSVILLDDGTHLNRSKSGILLSYSYNFYDDNWSKHGGHVHGDSVGGTRRVSIEMYVGIGYVEARRLQIIPEARESVSDEDLEKGVKVYLIQVVDKRLGDKTGIAIPVAFPESKQIFRDYLIEYAERSSPEQIID